MIGGLGGGCRGETGVGQGKREEVGLWRRQGEIKEAVIYATDELQVTLQWIFFFLIADNILHLDVHYVCYTMLVQSFQLQGRHFTNFRYYF